MITICIQKHIHSNSASWSSNDTSLEFITNSNDFNPNLKEGHSFFNMDIPFEFLNGERIDRVTGDDEIIFYHLNPCKEFHYGNFTESHHNSYRYKNHIDKLTAKGWNIEDYTTPERLAYRERSYLRQEEQDKKDGLVLWKRYENRTTADYKGGFSDEVFHTDKLLNYIGDGKCVYGWMGDSQVRTPELDKVIEKGFTERGLTPEQMYSWLSSSNGRHFADNLTFYETEQERIEQIEANLNSFYNKCIIYDSPEHQGTLYSTNELYAKYQTLGILLPENETDFGTGKHFVTFMGPILENKEKAGMELNEIEKQILNNYKKRFK